MLPKKQPVEGVLPVREEAPQGPEVNINDLVQSFRRVDLNLFVVFATIYEYRSLTGASGHFNLTQPAVSHALSRLRETLNDKLFIRKAGQSVPTPFAHAIIDDVRRAQSSSAQVRLGSRCLTRQVQRRTFGYPWTHQWKWRFCRAWLNGYLCLHRVSACPRPNPGGRYAFSNGRLSFRHTDYR